MSKLNCLRRKFKIELITYKRKIINLKLKFKNCKKNSIKIKNLKARKNLKYNNIRLEKESKQFKLS